MKNQWQTWLLDTLLLCLALSTFYAFFLAKRSLSLPDEARYSEIAREMLASKQFLIPHLNGIRYFEKPPLFYWFQSLSIHTLGLNEWGFRAPNAIMAILGCLANYAGARVLFSRKTGIFSALILATSLLYYTMGHMVSLDITLSTFITSSLLSFLAATNSTQHRKQLIWLAFLFAAFAVLTKGLIGVIFPIMIVGTWILLLNKWHLLTKLHLPSAIILFLIITIPWHLLVQLKAPDFFHYYFIQQQFLRFGSHLVHFEDPWWFYLPVLLLGFFPWTCFLFQTCINSIKNINSKKECYTSELFLLLWAGLILCFYSISQSKLIPYITTALPPLAILVSKYLTESSNKRSGIFWGYFSTTALAIFILTVSIIYLEHTHRFNEHNYFAIIGLIIFTFGAANALLQSLYNKKMQQLPTYRRLLPSKWVPQAPLVLLIATTAISFCFLLQSAAYHNPKSVKPLAIYLKKIIKPNDKVVTYNTYYQDLPVYLDQTVIIANWTGELAYGEQHSPEADQYIIHGPQFWRLWHSNQTIYIILSRDEYAKLRRLHPKINPHILKQTSENLLATNKGN